MSRGTITAEELAKMETAAHFDELREALADMGFDVPDAPQFDANDSPFDVLTRAVSARLVGADILKCNPLLRYIQENGK